MPIEPDSLPSDNMILPNAWIGVVGGGQLGRMFTLAAKNLGYNVMILEPLDNSPAAQVADHHIQASYDDPQALQQLGEHCDVVTTEFENIPAKALALLSQYCTVHPSANAMEKTQDRAVEKAFIRECGLLPVPYAAIESEKDFEHAIKAVEFPAILKSSRLGYDGKGQQPVNSADELRTAFIEIGKVPCVLEQRVDLHKEASAILARKPNGECSHFPVGENIHKQGILYQSIVPARLDQALTRSIQAAAERIADKLDFVGVMAVEFFITKQGELLVNEIAPRTHNSGHYSQDACITSQFEQQLRTICNLPFGSTTLLSPVVMNNLLGDLWNNAKGNPDWQIALQHDQCKLHLYGKQEARAGRKMGHFNLLNKDIDQAIATADSIMDQLQS